MLPSIFLIKDGANTRAGRVGSGLEWAEQRLVGSQTLVALGMST